MVSLVHQLPCWVLWQLLPPYRDFFLGSRDHFAWAMPVGTETHNSAHYLLLAESVQNFAGQFFLRSLVYGHTRHPWDLLFSVLPNRACTMLPTPTASLFLLPNGTRTMLPTLTSTDLFSVLPNGTNPKFTILTPTGPFSVLPNGTDPKLTTLTPTGLFSVLPDGTDPKFTTLTPGKGGAVHQEKTAALNESN